MRSSSASSRSQLSPTQRSPDRNTTQQNSVNQDNSPTQKAYRFEMSLPTMAIFTGANTPLTRALAIKFAEMTNHNSAILISAQNNKTLESTAHQLRKCHKFSPSKTGLEVNVAALDFVTNTESICETLTKCFGPPADINKRFKQALVVHNAGRITVSKRPQDFSADEVANYLRLNVTSAICLNTAFMDITKNFGPSATVSGGVIKRFVVNISSPLAVKPVAGLGLGCASKAAREAYFGVVALEDPTINVINYSPGPIRIDTWQTLVDSTLNENIRQRDVLMHSSEDASFLTIDTKATVGKLLQILEKGSYNSGEHVEYLDASKDLSPNPKYKPFLATVSKAASLDFLG